MLKKTLPAREQIAGYSIPSWKFFAMFSLLICGISIAGYAYYSDQKSRLLEDTFKDIGAIADLKVAQIAKWREGRLTDAEVVLKNPYVFSELRSWLKKGGIDAGVMAGISSWFEAFKEQKNYASIFIVDSALRQRFSSEGKKPSVAAEELSAIAEAARTGKAAFSNFFTDKEGNVFIDVIAPIPSAGFIVFRMDPHRYLYPMLKSWPTKSPTGETLLVRREGNDVLFLNELRHKKDAALAIKLPMDNKELPASFAARGEKREMEGIDYRGVPVFAVTRPIPGSGWALVAKIDRSEIYGSLHERAVIVAGLVILLTAAVALGVVTVWRRGELEFYKERLESERKRLALVKHFEYLTKYANDIMILANEERRIIEANDRAVSIYGYDRDELIAMRIDDLRTPGERPIAGDTWEEIGTSGGKRYETVHCRRDGRTFPVEVSARIIMIDEKPFYQEVIHDISDRKRAEEQLGRAYSDLELKVAQRTHEIMEANARLTEEMAERKDAEVRLRSANAYTRSLIEASLDPLVTIGTDGRITDVNAATERVTGFNRRELIGTDFSDYFTEPMNAKSGYEEAFRKSAVRDLALEIRHINGTVTPVLYNAAVYRDESGVVIGVFAAARDISARKKAEEEIFAMQAELADAKRLSDIGSLAATVAHELRNPLGVIRAATYNIRRKAKNPLLDKHLNNIDENIMESSRIIDNLLFYSRIKKPSYEKVKIAGLVGECVQTVKHRFEHHKVAIEAERGLCPLEGTDIDADPGQLKEVFNNIIGNAIQAIEGQDGTVEIDGAPDGKNSISITVRDTGVGIDPADIDRIFEPFFTTRSRGTGLGLSICRELVHLHKGDIRVESEKGKGTNVTVTLPIGA